MTEKAVKDVLIIGGGPAGLSALLWCNELGLSAILVERRSELGGQMLWIHNEIKNYPGRVAKNGREMRDHFLVHFDRLDEQVMLNSEIVSFDASKISARLADGSIVHARSAIIATGLRRRRLGIPGEDELVGRGILSSGAGQRELAKGKRVAIIGGGDAAIENALILSEFAEKVFLIHRSDNFRARREFVEGIKKKNNIEVIANHSVTSINGDSIVRSIDIVEVPTTDGPSDISHVPTQTIAVDLVLIRAGFEPNTELFHDQLDLDKNGYIVVDHLGQTSVPNIFAAGDVACPASPTVAAAIGAGAIVAKAIKAFLNN